MSFAGLVSVAIVLSDSGDVLEDPVVALLGIRRSTPRAQRSARLSRRRSTMRSMPAEARRRDAEAVREAVRRAVRGEIEPRGGRSRRPSCTLFT